MLAIVACGRGAPMSREDALHAAFDPRNGPAGRGLPILSLPFVGAIADPEAAREVAVFERATDSHVAITGGAIVVDFADRRGVREAIEAAWGRAPGDRWFTPAGVRAQLVERGAGARVTWRPTSTAADLVGIIDGRGLELASLDGVRFAALPRSDRPVQLEVDGAGTVRLLTRSPGDAADVIAALRARFGEPSASGAWRRGDLVVDAVPGADGIVIELRAAKP